MLILELADADPLGVDQNIDFTAVGGLDDCKLPSLIQLTIRYQSAQRDGDFTTAVS